MRAGPHPLSAQHRLARHGRGGHDVRTRDRLGQVGDRRDRVTLRRQAVGQCPRLFGPARPDLDLVQMRHARAIGRDQPARQHPRAHDQQPAAVRARQDLRAQHGIRAGLVFGDQRRIDHRGQRPGFGVKDQHRPLHRRQAAGRVVAKDRHRLDAEPPPRQPRGPRQQAARPRPQEQVTHLGGARQMPLSQRLDGAGPVQPAGAVTVDDARCHGTLRSFPPDPCPNRDRAQGGGWTFRFPW